jgi:hypothetical protein
MARVPSNLFYLNLVGNLNNEEIKHEVFIRDFVIKEKHININSNDYDNIVALVLSGQVKLNERKSSCVVNKFLCLCREVHYPSVIYHLPNSKYQHNSYLIEPYCASKIEEFVINIRIDFGKRNFKNLYHSFYLLQLYLKYIY